MVLDALVQPVAIDAGQSIPPQSSSGGDMHIVATGAATTGHILSGVITSSVRGSCLHFVFCVNDGNSRLDTFQRKMLLLGLRAIERPLKVG